MGLGFSQTFVLDRSLLSSALRALHANPGIDDKTLAQEIGVGGRKGMGFSAWLLYTGLRTSRPKQLSEMGELILHFDPYFLDVGTCAALHYQLCANTSATVWNLLSMKFIPQKFAFSRKEATDFCIAQGLGKEGARNKHLVSDIGIFLQAYTNPEGLQALDYLSKQADESYRKGDIARKIHPLLVAYVIYAQRERGIQTSTLAIRSLLNDDGNVGKVFLMDREILLEKLRQLEVEGLVRISQEADLDNIAFTYTGSSLDILKRYYEMNIKDAHQSY